MSTQRRRSASFDVDVLDNGVRVVVAPLPAFSRVHIFVQLRGGPVHEDDATWGLSHFLEHMVFRGTDRHRDVRALSLAADALGGDVAAATYRDRVTFDTRCDPDRVREAFHILAAMIAAPRFGELAVERAIIEEEIADLFDDDGRDADPENAMFARLFSGHVLARSIEGTPEQLRRYDRAAVRAFHGQMYVGGNVVLSVAGPVEPRRVRAWAAESFGRVRCGTSIARGAPPRRVQARSPIHVVRTDAPQTSVRVCMPLPGVKAPDAPTALALARLLDDGPASRLQARLVDRDGLAYSVWAMADLYEDRGVLELGGTVRHERVGDLVEGLMAELLALAVRAPTRDELSRTARRAARDLRDTQDDPALLAEAVGRGVLFDDPFRPVRAVAALRAVTPAHVQALVRSGACALQVVLGGMPPRTAVQRARATLTRAVQRAGRW